MQLFLEDQLPIDLLNGEGLNTGCIDLKMGLFADFECPLNLSALFCV
jgi:hypothetical protein